jgi:hypothetical protein
MKSSQAYPSRLSVPQWRPHLVVILLLTVIISACGGSGGGSVSVDQFGFDSTTVSWTPPTQNEDGSPLTDLAGYKIYYGNESGNYQRSIQIDNPGITIYVVENLTPNTYYFVMTAINSSGIESRYSNELRRQVP